VIPVVPAIDSYGAPRGIAESDLLRAYGEQEQARPCVCGGVVIADPRDPTEGVREHQATPKHVAWRGWVEL
jgi:hypothetical protein